MTQSISDRPTALVTGAAKRIGRAIVEDLAAHGFDVAIHCHASTREAEELAERVAALGRRTTIMSADLTDVDEADELVGRATDRLGPVALLVNSASVFEDDAVDTFEWDIFDRHFALHVKAPLALTRAFVRLLPASSCGLVVNVIDQRVWKPTPRHFSYGLSKSALWSATRTMAQALAPRVRVNAIGPGPTLANQRQSTEDFERQSSTLLLGRGPSLDEFGATIRYLWGARSVTGQMIAIDGGQHLAWQTPDAMGKE